MSYAIGDDKRRQYARLRAQRLAAARQLGTHTEQQWEDIKATYGGRCVRCGCLAPKLVKDHIKPIYQGGSDAIGNLQPLCVRCNSAKGPEATDWREYRDLHGFGGD